MKLLGLNKIKDAKEQEKIKQFCTAAVTNNLYNTDVFSIIPNAEGIYPSFDIYPLAKPPKEKLPTISAVLTDMDGTTTTTETLCLHAQEFMIQNITKRAIPALDPEADYPFIIGNSTTKHVEYLIKKYGHAIDQEALKIEYFFAALWTLLYSVDPGRKKDVAQTLKLLGVYPATVQQAEKIRAKKQLSNKELHEHAKPLAAALRGDITEFGLQVRMAIDAYYQRYHEILKGIAEGHSDTLAKELTHGKRMIEPMSGIAVFLSLLKGWLGEEAAKVIKKDNAAQLGTFFVDKNIKIGLVTSSIFYEADIVLSEVFKVIQKEVEAWSISEQRKKRIIEGFSNYNNVYETVVTASDSHEIRLKPHRDLYSIGLYNMGVPRDQFGHALGFEDSESGLLAIRAAGIGNAIGIPFDATKGHNLEAATTILHDGLMEFITTYNCFLDLQ